MVPVLDIFGAQINVVGEFNPPIFTPEWLRDNELLGEADTESAKKSAALVITPDVVRFDTEWFYLQVVRQQFVLNSKGPLTPAFKDLATSIFSLVAHTPMSAIGLNFVADYKISNSALYHKIGDALAPKKIWYKFFEPSDTQSVGLTELVIEVDPFKRGEEATDSAVKKFTVRASKDIPNGVFFALNDHYPVKVTPKSGETQAERTIAIIEEHWEPSMTQAKDVFLGVLTEAMNS